MGIRLSDKYLTYSLASVFEMVSSPAFNVSMFVWSLPVAVPFFISRSAGSTSHDVIFGTSLGSVWIMVLCHIARCRILIFYDHILIMDFSTLLVKESLLVQT